MYCNHLTPADREALAELELLIAELRVCRLELLVFGKANFNPGQPRVPAGRPGGGQWTAQPYPDAIEEIYPLETAFGLLTAGQALLVLKTLRLGRSAIAASENRIKKAAESIEEYLGGPGKAVGNKHGDTIIMRENKKIRFDINNPKPHKEPHFHIQQRTPNGRWRNVGKQRYTFKRSKMS